MSIKKKKKRMGIWGELVARENLSKKHSPDVPECVVLNVL